MFDDVSGVEVPDGECIKLTRAAFDRAWSVTHNGGKRSDEHMEAAWGTFCAESQRREPKELWQVQHEKFAHYYSSKKQAVECAAGGQIIHLREVVDEEEK